MSDEFERIAKTLIRQIENSIDDNLWNREVSAEVVAKLNELARDEFGTATNIFEFVDEFMPATHQAVDPKLKQNERSDSHRNIGFVFRDAFSRDTCDDFISLWEFSREKKEWAAVDINKSSRKKATNVVNDWLDFLRNGQADTKTDTRTNAKTTRSQGATLHQRMMAEFADNPGSGKWSAREWKTYLGSGSHSGIMATAAWKTFDSFRVIRDAENDPVRRDR